MSETFRDQHESLIEYLDIVSDDLIIIIADEINNDRVATLLNWAVFFIIKVIHILKGEKE